MTIRLNSDRVNCLLVKISSDDIPEMVALLKNTWTEFAPDLPFEYYFLDEDIDRFYQTKQRFSRIATYASLFAIGIACLGLLGLSAYTTEQRRKELGVRKVLGASRVSLVMFDQEKRTAIGPYFVQINRRPFA